MKVLYAFPEPLPIPRARGIQCANTAAALAGPGVEVVLYHVPGPGHPIRAYGLEVPQGLQVRPLSRSLPWPFVRVHSNRLFLARLLREAGPELDRSVIFVRHLKLAALLLRRKPVPRIVYEAHEVFADTAPRGKAADRRSEESLVMHGAAAVVCNSRATAERLVALYGAPHDLEVIPNGVHWPAVLPEKEWAHPERHIVYAGSFFPWKGVADLVEAAQQLVGCRIELIGGDPHRVHDLERQAGTGGAELVLTGHLSHAEVLNRLAGACIAVLPNRGGTDSAFTSPIKLFEYMAAGCAVVASDLPSVREVLDDGDAVWARPDDPASLADAIRRLAADPERAREMGERVREKSRQFTWKARAERLRKILDRVARQQR